MNTFLISQTLHYLIHSHHKFGHRIHSPFVYDLITKCLRKKTPKSTFNLIEQRRKQLLCDNSVIEIEDFGAGSKQLYSNKRVVKNIARTSLSQGKYARLLYNLVEYFKPKNILELGTSLGISGSYLSTCDNQSRIFTLEGSPEIAKIAEKTFDFCSVKNAEIVIGNFNNTLQKVLEQMQTVNFAFIDGNHTKEATLQYFEQIVPFCTENSVLVFDDISWSEGMNQAWQIITNDQRVSVSIDMCKVGLVFFRSGIVKQHFVIRY